MLGHGVSNDKTYTKRIDFDFMWRSRQVLEIKISITATEICEHRKSYFEQK